MTITQEFGIIILVFQALKTCLAFALLTRDDTRMCLPARRMRFNLDMASACGSIQYRSFNWFSSAWLARLDASMWAPARMLRHFLFMVACGSSQFSGRAILGKNVHWPYIRERRCGWIEQLKERAWDSKFQLFTFYGLLNRRRSDKISVIVTYSAMHHARYSNTVSGSKQLKVLTLTAIWSEESTGQQMDRR